MTAPSSRDVDRLEALAAVRRAIGELSRASKLLGPHDQVLASQLYAAGSRLVTVAGRIRPRQEAWR